MKIIKQINKTNFETLLNVSTVDTLMMRKKNKNLVNNIIYRKNNFWNGRNVDTNKNCNIE